MSVTWSKGTLGVVKKEVVSVTCVILGSMFKHLRVITLTPKFVVYNPLYKFVVSITQY